MKLGIKLITGFFVVALLVGFVGISGVISNNTIQKNNKIAAELIELEHLLDISLVQLLQLIETENVEDYNTIKSEFENIRPEFDMLYGKYRKFIHDLGAESFDENLDEFTKISNGIIAFHKRKLGKIREFEEKKALGRSTQELEEIANEQKIIGTDERLKVKQLQGIIDRLEEDEEQIVNTIHLKNESLAKNTMRTLLIVILIAFIGSIVLGLYISSSISKPITKLSQTATEIGKGNLDVKTDINSKDELGELAKTINKMAVDLKHYQTRLLKAEKLKSEDLDQEVKKKTKELSEKIVELEKFNKLAVGRELKMIELKKEIKELEIKLGGVKNE